MNMLNITALETTTQTIQDFAASDVAFWLMWMTIPLVLEVIPGFFQFIALIFQGAGRKKGKKKFELNFYPTVTVILPIYNSNRTLRWCIESIAKSNYDITKITVLCVDNGSKDNSFDVFKDCKDEFPKLNMSWMTSQNGKSRAMNQAIYNTGSQYFINADTDGFFEVNAIRNIVTMFEADPEKACVTASVLIDPRQIKDYNKNSKNIFMNVTRIAEFYEYCQSFLVGRAYQSIFGNLFTLSGACSAFRMSTLAQSQMYNTDTLAEDTHMTFQIRSNMNKKVHSCTDALFFVDPIDTLNRLYTQRQRWQTGELEVMHMFLNKKMKSRNFFTNMAVRTTFFDHTFAFPRIIWYFAIIFLVMITYPGKMVILSFLLMFLIYFVEGIFFFFNSLVFLRRFKEVQKYYAKRFWILPILPLYQTMIFVFRFASIINSSGGGNRSWATRNFTQEGEAFREVIKNDFTLHMAEKSSKKKKAVKN